MPPQIVYKTGLFSCDKTSMPDAYIQYCSMLRDQIQARMNAVSGSFSAFLF